MTYAWVVIVDGECKDREILFEGVVEYCMSIMECGV